jgi:HK97 family phage portal protein
MGVIDFLFRDAINRQVNQQLQSLQNTQSAIMRGVAVYGNGEPLENINKGYLSSADVYSIVRRIAKTANTIPVLVYKVKDKSALKKYLRLKSLKDYSTQHQLKMMRVKERAFDLVEQESDPLVRLLDNPNPIYAKSEFMEGFFTFRLLTGNSYILKDDLEFGVDAGKTQNLWLMPSQFTNPIITNTFPHEITGYQLIMGSLINISKDNVLHSRYFNPEFTTYGNELIGLSPLKAAHKVLQRNADEIDYSTAAFQNSGISGIVSNENVTDMRSETAGALKKDFYTEGSGTHNAKKLLFTAGKIAYTQIGLSPVDMQVLESEVRTFKRLCNIYGVSDVLFNNGEASTESNVKEMIKQMYTNAALPEVYAWCDLINKYVAPSFGNYFVDVDLSEITVLQDDLKAMSEVFATLPVMVPNHILEAFSFGKIEDEMMDRPFIKSGYQMLDDFKPIDDV